MADRQNFMAECQKTALTAICVFGLLTGAAGAAEKQQRFEATVKVGGHSRTVPTLAKDYWEARENIEAQFCPNRGCIQEGPRPVNR